MQAQRVFYDSSSVPWSRELSVALQMADGVVLRVPSCYHSYESYPQVPREAHIMRIARDLQITLKQFSARVQSLSTPRFQDMQKASNS